MNRVDVRCALELSQSDKKKIEDFFNRKFGKCEFAYLSEPELIGGIVAQCGDEIFDASVLAKLDKIKNSLL